MKKIFLIMFCLFCALTVKAANYEIATALSSPYGIYSTFTVFDDATVKDLFIGAKSVNNSNVYGTGYPVVHKPMQEGSLNILGTLILGGNINVVGGDLELRSNQHLYNNMIVTTLSTNDTVGNPWIEGTSAVMNFNCTPSSGTPFCVIINNLNAKYFSANEIKISAANNFNSNNLYTRTLTITNNTVSFTFPSMRNPNLAGNDDADETPIGAGLYAETPNTKNCSSTGNNRNIYGPWKSCQWGASTCPPIDFLGDDLTICDDNINPCDGHESDETYSCVQTRDVDYAVPKVDGENIDIVPNISSQEVVYRKCSYQETSEEAGAYRCHKPDGVVDFGETISGTKEEVIIGNVGFSDMASFKPCGYNAPTSCRELCALYDSTGGCSNMERRCLYYDGYTPDGGFQNVGRIIGSSTCGESGWEKGSGLECIDSYTRIVYTTYSCPANSDYTQRPSAEAASGIRKVKQYRKVTCVQKDYITSDTGTNYCSTKFLTIK